MLSMVDRTTDSSAHVEPTDRVGPKQADSMKFEFTRIYKCLARKMPMMSRQVAYPKGSVLARKSPFAYTASDALKHVSAPNPVENSDNEGTAGWRLRPATKKSSLSPTRLEAQTSRTAYASKKSPSYAHTAVCTTSQVALSPKQARLSGTVGDSGETRSTNHRRKVDIFSVVWGIGV